MPLEVRGLSVDRRFKNAWRPVVREAGFELARGEVVGLLGESGCGKTTLALALLGLHPPSRWRVRGSARLDGLELAGLDEEGWRGVRGRRIGLIPQDPLLALNPVLRAGDQVAEAWRAHRGGSGASRRSEVERLFRLLDLAEPARVYDSWPHLLSGGERQRVAVAAALAAGPAVLIADEPFTALDAPRTLELAALLARLARELETSMLVIAHDPGALGLIAGTVMVMYAGRIVERGAPRQVFGAPLHPYTAALLAARDRLAPIPGTAAESFLAAGCPFAPRCGEVVEPCAASFPASSARPGGGAVHCFRHAG